MAAIQPLRVLVVDDTIVYRRGVSDIIAALPDCEVVGTAANGEIAMHRVASLRPDLLILDVEMPQLDGLGVLRRLRESAPETGAIVLSALSRESRDLTVHALELGAFDFVAKPVDGTPEANRDQLRATLAPLIAAFARSRRNRVAVPAGQAVSQAASVPVPTTPRIAARPAPGRSPADIVGIGVSTGGPNALQVVLPALPADFPTPVLVVQHMPPLFTESLAKSLDARCALRVKEACDGEPVVAGTIYIAPGGRHMKVTASGDRTVIRITDDPPEKSCRPSVDYLFRSLALRYGDRATGVIMTGMGNDGTVGLQLMKRAGATVIAQDEESCTVFGMPREPIAAGIVDFVAPLTELAATIRRTVGAPTRSSGSAPAGGQG